MAMSYQRGKCRLHKTCAWLSYGQKSRNTGSSAIVVDPVIAAEAEVKRLLIHQMPLLPPAQLHISFPLSSN